VAVLRVVMVVMITALTRRSLRHVAVQCQMPYAFLKGNPDGTTL
jgi:hypothetical protein